MKTILVANFVSMIWEKWFSVSKLPEQITTNYFVRFGKMMNYGINRL
jgi:hypothetical protein